MKINLNLFSSDLDNKINEINNHLNNLNDKIDEFLNRLATIGFDTANEIIDRAKVENINHANNTDANVRLEKRDNGYSIIAYGTQILFIEFGTGIEATHPYGKDFGMVESSYSDTHAQIYAEKGFWYYRGEKLVGTTAYMPMYYACVEMENRILEIAREVFES